MQWLLEFQLLLLIGNITSSIIVKWETDILVEHSLCKEILMVLLKKDE